MTKLAAPRHMSKEARLAWRAIPVRMRLQPTSRLREGFTAHSVHAVFKRFPSVIKRFEKGLLRVSSCCTLQCYSAVLLEHCPSGYIILQLRFCSDSVLRAIKQVCGHLLGITNCGLIWFRHTHSRHTVYEPDAQSSLSLSRRGCQS